jgi:hypothetical protein
MRYLSLLTSCVFFLALAAPARCGDEVYTPAPTTAAAKAAAAKAAARAAGAQACPCYMAAGDSNDKAANPRQRRLTQLEIDNLLRPIWGCSPPGQ